MLPDQLQGLAEADGCPTEHQAMQRAAGVGARAETSIVPVDPWPGRVSETAIPKSGAYPRSVSMGPCQRG